MGNGNISGRNSKGNNWNGWGREMGGGGVVVEHKQTKYVVEDN